MTLKNQRGAQSAIVTNITKFISEFHLDHYDVDKAQIELELRLKMMRGARNEYLRLNDEIVKSETDEEVVKQCNKSQDEFIEKCVNLEIDIEKFLTEITLNNKKPQDGDSFSHDILQKLTSVMQTLAEKSVSSTKNTRPGTSHLKLPKHEIPSFSGKYSDWLHFKDIFEASINNHPHLSDVEKLAYLKSSLHGEAANEIKHLAITNENYNIAWDAINRRYDQKSPIINEYIRIFLNQSSINKPNADNIRQLISTSSTTVNVLDSLNANDRDPWLIYTVLQKLDEETRMLWARESIDEENPTWNDFVDFISSHCRTLERAQNTNLKQAPQASFSNKPTHKHEHSKNHTSSFITTEAALCKNCSSGNHPLFKCSKFISMSPELRFAFIKQMHLCRNCITDTHMTAICKFHSCKKCHGKHNILLHEYFIKHENKNIPQTHNTAISISESNIPNTLPHSDLAQQSATSTAVNSQNTTTNSALTTNVIYDESILNNNISSISCISSAAPKVFLATALVRIRDSKNGWCFCRAVLDCASQVNLMTTDLCHRLGLKKLNSKLSLAGVTEQKNEIKHASTTTIQSRINDTSYKLDCFVVPKITGSLPNWYVDPKNFPIPSQLQLADPQWHVQMPVELLIGGKHYWNIILNDTISIGDEYPILINTSLGWIIAGEHAECEKSLLNYDLSCNLTTNSQLDMGIRKFWEMEDVSTEKIESIEHKEVEQHFMDTYCREDDGRYIVALPFREDVVKLGNSRQKAIRSFHALENRLERNPVFLQQYNSQLNEYLQKGFMEETTYDPNVSNFYMPHHGVIKDSSLTTKMRIVFNGSALTTSGLSLNCVLKSAETVQPDLITILNRFRIHPIAMSCDITKMYLQIKLIKPHADFQRIIWRKYRDELIKDYKITRVCFGVKSSPFLATRVLNQLANDEKSKYPLASSCILENFYVDDGLISCANIDEAIATQKELVEIMKSGGFTLSKWNANRPELLQTVNENLSQSNENIIITDQTVKTLGLMWCAKSDTFQYTVPMNFEMKLYSKREVISIISGLFDPAGLVGCILTEAKLIMQETWKLKLEWNDILPEPLQNRWIKFLTTLPELNDIKIPRWISDIANPISYELHGFSDASIHAYGCSVYLITRSIDGHISSYLLMSKSRIAPVNPSTTIPRLELCGAEICAKLVNRLKIELNINECYFWCDSEIVLHWIHSPCVKWNIFINNRINFINGVTNRDQWRHVKSAENPADMISRGCSPKTLSQSSVWFYGPDWLVKDKNNWPQPFQKYEPDLPVIMVAISNKDRVNLQEFYQLIIASKSSLPKIQRVIAYCKRFISNCRLSKNKRELGELTATEMRNALLLAVGMDQQLHFHDVIKSLSSNTYSKQLKGMVNLNPFLDENKLIRVTGRLQNSDENYDTKHPLILPHSHLAIIIARHYHETNLHAGSQLLLATLRQQFWPIGGRSFTRQICRKCVVCFKVKPRFMPQLMGNLPESRVNIMRCFQSSGVDFAGPINIRLNLKRGAPATKAYICIFVCMSTKACHLDVCSSLSTNAFIACFKRFIARRSRPDEMFSDNGTNFVGCDNQLREFLNSKEFQSSINNEAASHNIKWSFQPPRSPHHGGLWEACVKSVKHHLRRVAGQATLTYEELSTVLTQIEAVLNSRPLTPLSEDSNDPPHLTPGHFLVGCPLNALPDPNFTSIPITRLNRWQLCQRMVQDFSNRWKLEYLTCMQKRNKWSKISPNFKPGDIVLLHEDNQPSIKWPLGKVDKVYPGKDGNVRVVDVRTQHGIVRRSIQKLSKLALDLPSPEDVGELPLADRSTTYNDETTPL